MKELNEAGIGAKAFWKPVHLQEPYANSLTADDLSVTEALWSRVVTLPCSTGISDPEIATVIRTTRALLKGGDSQNED